MIRRAKKARTAQSLLDFILVFAALLTLTIGLVRIWVWFNANFAKQAIYYQNTRLEAITPTDSSHKKLVFNKEKMRLPLTKDWVFKGIPSGTVGSSDFAGAGDDATLNPTTEGGSCGNERVCSNARQTAVEMNDNADSMDDQAKKMKDFISVGDKWYKPLYVVFIVMGIDTDAMNQSIKDLKKGARDLRLQAKDMVDKACKPCAPPAQETTP